MFTPVSALQVELGEMPLKYRRMQLAMIYWANLCGHNGNHPGIKVLGPSQERERAQLTSFGWMIEQLLDSLELPRWKLALPSRSQ